MDEGHEGEEFSKKRAQEELEASCHMTGLGEASATSVPNELYRLGSMVSPATAHVGENAVPWQVSRKKEVIIMGQSNEWLKSSPRLWPVAGRRWFASWWRDPFTGGHAPCRGGGGDAERGGAQGRGLGVGWGAQMVLRPLLSLQHTLRDDQCAYGHFS